MWHAQIPQSGSNYSSDLNWKPPWKMFSRWNCGRTWSLTRIVMVVSCLSSPSGLGVGASLMLEVCEKEETRTGGRGITAHTTRQFDVYIVALPTDTDRRCCYHETLSLETWNLSCWLRARQRVQYSAHVPYGMQVRSTVLKKMKLHIPWFSDVLMRLRNRLHCQIKYVRQHDNLSVVRGMQ